jgi:hypothetical protein
VEEIADIKTAVSVAVTNCIVHALPVMSQDLHRAGLYEDGKVG